MSIIEEVKKLEQENKRMREALEDIVEFKTSGHVLTMRGMMNVAKWALSKGKEKEVTK